MCPNLPLKNMETKESVATLSTFLFQVGSIAVFHCAGSEASKISSLIRMSALSSESWTMTAIDHHSMIGDSNCTNSTISTVKSACRNSSIDSLK